MPLISSSISFALSLVISFSDSILSILIIDMKKSAGFVKGGQEKPIESKYYTALSVSLKYIIFPCDSRSSLSKVSKISELG
jgi:hypothetical protein